MTPDRLMPNGNVSPKLRMLGWILGYVGIPGVIAGWLVYVGSTKIPDMGLKVELIYAQGVEAQKRDNELKLLLEANYRMLQRICANTARNYDERNRCFDQ